MLLDFNFHSVFRSIRHSGATRYTRDRGCPFSFHYSSRLHQIDSTFVPFCFSTRSRTEIAKNGAAYARSYIRIWGGQWRFTDRFSSNGSSGGSSSNTSRCLTISAKSSGDPRDSRVEIAPKSECRRRRRWCATKRRFRDPRIRDTVNSDIHPWLLVKPFGVCSSACSSERIRNRPGLSVGKWRRAFRDGDLIHDEVPLRNRRSREKNHSSFPAETGLPLTSLGRDSPPGGRGCVTWSAAWERTASGAAGATLLRTDVKTPRGVYNVRTVYTGLTGRHRRTLRCVRSLSEAASALTRALLCAWAPQASGIGSGTDSGNNRGDKCLVGEAAPRLTSRGHQRMRPRPAAAVVAARESRSCRGRRWAAAAKASGLRRTIARTASAAADCAITTADRRKLRKDERRPRRRHGEPLRLGAPLLVLRLVSCERYDISL